MIVNIRGTSGSGKSTLVRRVCELYPRKFPVKQQYRKQPIGYIYTRPEGASLAVVGHYETDCGGCDTITNMDEIYSHVLRAHNDGMDVLYEGLLISADANRAIWLKNEVGKEKFVVVALDTPLELCLQSVNERRYNSYQRRVDKVKAENLCKEKYGHKLIPIPEFKGDVNPKNTQSKFQGVKSSMKRLQEADVDTFTGSRDQAFAFIKDCFGHGVSQG